MASVRDVERTGKIENYRRKKKIKTHILSFIANPNVPELEQFKMDEVEITHFCSFLLFI